MEVKYLFDGISVAVAVAARGQLRSSGHVAGKKKGGPTTSSLVQIVHSQSPVTSTASAGRFDSDFGEQKAKVGSELSNEG
jgi:hypothetical protein